MEIDWFGLFRLSNPFNHVLKDFLPGPGNMEKGGVVFEWKRNKACIAEQQREN